MIGENDINHACSLLPLFSLPPFPFSSPFLPSSPLYLSLSSLSPLPPFPSSSRSSLAPLPTCLPPLPPFLPRQTCSWSMDCSLKQMAIMKSTMDANWSRWRWKPSVRLAREL